MILIYLPAKFDDVMNFIEVFFDYISDVIITIIIGAIIIHELIGPVLAKMALKKAGEINNN